MNLKNFPKRLDSKTSSLRIAVPENLDLALEGLIRKVLREQPKTDDIYSFAADYFETLLKIRDKAGAKFTTGQLCPFHNDEDAHEMIKLAGTFAKPKFKTDDGGKMRKPSKKKETDAKTNKRTKTTGNVKDKQPVKQVTPDLIKKLPTVTQPEVEKKTQTSDSQGRDSEEATPEEFLTSDPIKELVEKELMMEAGKNKTDGNDKTGDENAQGEEKPIEMVDSKEKNQENEETNTKVETKKETENEKTQTEAINISEDAEAGEKEPEDVKADTENCTKEEDVREDVMKTGETQEEGDVIKEAEQSETVPEVPKTGEVHRNEKKEIKTHKEVNKKMETFPVSESGKKVMDVLPSEKLPEITEDVTEKNPDSTQTESEQQPNNSQIPTDTKDQTSTESVTKQVQETLASIPEHIPLELSPDGATQPETDNASNEAKDNQKPEETPITDRNAQPTGDEQTNVENQEKEAENPQKNSQEENQDEQPVETTAEKPKPEDSFTVSEDKTFGEVINNTEEEETTAESEETKPNEAGKIPVEATKPQERTKTVDDGEPPIEKVDEKTTEEHIKPTKPTPDKPADTDNSTQVDNKTPEISEMKNDTTNTDESDNQETQTDDISGAQQAQPETVPEESTPNVDKEASETTTSAIEIPGDELCSVVDNKQAPTDDKISVEKTEEESEPDKPATEGTQNIEKEQETTETKQTEELCTVVDVPKEPETAQKSEDNFENMQTEQEELCRVVDNPKLDTTDEEKIQETQKEEVKPEMNEKNNDTPVEDSTDGEKQAGGEEKSTAEPTETPQTDTQHLIRVEEVEIPTKPDEIQIKTIQTHYYDTLQVPETVTREYRMHNLPTAGLLEAANFHPSNGLDENMNSTPENLIISPPGEENPTTPEQNTPAPVLPLDLQTHKTESDDLLDLMTPTSGYSMNLSEISLLTVSELFLDSEKRYSSLEKEETRYTVTPKPETANGREEVEEVIEKTILPSHVGAVPVPPRDGEELNEEANVQTTGNVKEEKKEEDKPENDSTEGSSNGRSVDSDVPFISVEVKTVIETQILDDEEEKNGERPEVEVKVQATIDIQDDVDMSQHALPTRVSVEEGNVTSSKESQEKPEETPGGEEESKDQDEEKQGVSSGGVEGSSSLDSDITGSSAATEIKRTDSSKRNLSSVRSLVSAQSLDLEKRNPLLKTRSLSNFRHGVTDFEVWNKIEKELEDAAIKIQSKFRGYKTRKKLQRGNAVQITTEESSVSTTPVEAEAKDEEDQQQQQQSTGEFHDSIVLSEHPH